MSGLSAVTASDALRCALRRALGVGYFVGKEVEFSIRNLVNATRAVSHSCCPDMVSRPRSAARLCATGLRTSHRLSTRLCLPQA